MGRVHSLVVGLLLLAPGMAAAAPAAPAERAPLSVEHDVDRALGGSHQRELPGVDPAAGDADRDLDREIEREMARGRLRGRNFDPRTGRTRDPGDYTPPNQSAPPAGPLSDLATWLLWGVVVVVALILALAIARQLSGYTGDDEQPAPDRKVSDEQLLAVVERPRDDADELAAQGRFADAIHTLLLRTLHELAGQNLVRVTRAMTSREILARVAMIGDARDALAGLIIAVEQTWFGDDVPALADYQRCRAQFDRFAAAYRRGARA